jgi:predicted transcriptional regulator
MSTIIKEKRVLKPVLQEVIEDYTQIVNNIGGIIKESGYKSNFIARKLRIPISTFYLKKRTKSFTLDEVTQIVGMLDDDDDIENEYLIELAESRIGGETISLTDMIKTFSVNEY